MFAFGFKESQIAQNYRKDDLVHEQSRLAVSLKASSTYFSLNHTVCTRIR